MSENEKPNDAILRRIRKMLAIAEGNANINESATAAGMASKLMAKYNLERADVLIEELDQDDIIAMEAEGSEHLSIPRWMNGLCVPVARLHDCEVRFARRFKDGKGYMVIEFLGQKEDAQVSAWVYTFLTSEVRRFSKVYRRQMRKEHGGGGHGINMEDYREGLCMSIRIHLDELQEAKRLAEQGHSSGTALVVRKQDMIRSKFKVAYEKGKSRTISQIAAYHQGREHGNSIRINKAIGTSQANGRLR